MSFQVGDRVRIREANSPTYGGRVGTVTKTSSRHLDPYTYKVALEDVDTPLGFNEHELVHAGLPAIEKLLRDSEEYPKNVGTPQESNGFGMTRDELIALLQECSPSVTIGVHDINHYESSGDSTSFRITVYATFGRSELDMPPRKV